MTPSIAFVGAGPTTIYTLCAFVEHAAAPATITVFEEQGRAGLRMPYRPGWNDPAMLSNIASVEIPPIEETLIDWLGRMPRSRLVRLGIDPDDIDDHAFYPRLALGEYFLEKFNSVVEHGRDRGLEIEVATRQRVTDIEALREGLRIHVDLPSGAAAERTFDWVVLATGHQWPEEPEVKPGYFLSPWPASALKRVPPTRVGIRGSSLTAIDAAVAVATALGDFVETEDGAVDYRISPGSEAFKLVMMSRKGLLPEADFYHPIPYEPLRYFTAEAVTAVMAEGGETLLERLYSLFKKELEAADPDYARSLRLTGLSLEAFADRYFEDRAAADPFDWAKANLVEAAENFEAEITVPWRYAILRMHEVMAIAIPNLEAGDLHRFNRFLKPVFIDDYATVPHLSIERLLALHRAGRLEVMALGDDYQLDSRGVETGATIIRGRERDHFPVLIDAIGQPPLAIGRFPFAALLEDGVVRDAATSDPGGAKGVDVDERYQPVSNHPAARRLYCLSIPFILGRHPFIQGITSSYEMGNIVGSDLAQRIAASAPQTSRHAGVEPA